MQAPETPDLAVAGLVVILALIAFIAVLWLNRDAKKGAKPAAGTVFTQEGGKSVRRSTRARKSVLSDEQLLATPAPKSPRASTAVPRTPKSPREAAKSPERVQSPGRTRKAAAKPAATPIAATPDTALRAAVSPTRRRAAATRRA